MCELLNAAGKGNFGLPELNSSFKKKLRLSRQPSEGAAFVLLGTLLRWRGSAHQVDNILRDVGSVITHPLDVLDHK